MSLWLLLDVFLLWNPQVIPCFSLLGFVMEKKVSWISILTVSLVWDFLFLSTHYLFLALFVFLKLVSYWCRRWRFSVFLHFTLIYVLFLLFCFFAFPSSFFLGERFFWTTFFLYFFLWIFIKKRKGA